MENFSQATEAAAKAQDSAGSAINENSKRMESLASKINLVKGAWENLVIELADSEQIGNLLDTVASILNTIANNEKAINAILTIGKALAVYAGLKISKNIFSGFITSAKNVLATGSKVVSILGSIIALLKDLPTYIALIKEFGLASTISTLLPALSGVATKITAIGGALATATPYIAVFGSLAVAIGLASGKLQDFYSSWKASHTDDVHEASDAYLELVDSYEKFEHAAKGTGYKKVSGQEALDALVDRLSDVTTNYNMGAVAAEDFLKQVGDISSLVTYYDHLQSIIDSGEKLTSTEQANYDKIKLLIGAYKSASAQLEQTANDTDVLRDATGKLNGVYSSAQSIYDVYKEQLYSVGDAYYFTTQAAKDSAVATQQAIIAEAQAVIEQTKKEIEARKALAETLSSTLYFTTDSKLSAGSAADTFAQLQLEKQQSVVKAAEKALKTISGIKVKTQVSTGSTTTSDTADKESTSDKASKLAQEKLEQRKKWLENYITAQRELYQKGEIDATTYYSNVQKKGKKYYDQLKAMGSDYADAAESMLEQYKSTNTTAVKDIFTEIEYQYKQGRITGQEYYEQLWKYAKKFYKNGKIEFSDYRDYIEKGYTELFGSIEQEYENGTITAEQYAKRVAEAQSAALKKINASGLGASVKKELKTALTDAVKEAKVSVAKALKEAAVAAAEKKLEEAEAALSKSEAFISALDFYAQEQMDAIDKVIEGYNAEIDKLNEKKELLDEQNDALDKQAERIKLVNELEDAKKQKTVRLYDSRYGWIWSADQSKVKQTQEELDEFDTTQKREKEKKAIENEVKAIEKLIKQKESEKQAYQDVIDEQTKALNRYNIEAELGKTIEEAIFDARTQNFTNWKDNYLIGTQEVIEATERVTQAQEALNKAQENLNIEQNRDWSSYDVDTTTTTPTKTTETRYTTKTNQPYEYDYSKTAVENWNAGQKANLAYYDKLGKKYKKWTDDDGKIHYKLLAKGSLGVPKSAIYNVNELGDELIVPPKGNFDYLKKGTGVIPANLTKNLMDWGKFNPSNFALNNQPSSVTNDRSITIQNLTVQSDSAKDFVRQLQNLAIVRS